MFGCNYYQTTQYWNCETAFDWQRIVLNFLRGAQASFFLLNFLIKKRSVGLTKITPFGRLALSLQGNKKRRGEVLITRNNWLNFKLL